MEHKWQPMTIAEVAARFRRVDVDWWIAGGFAIDLFLGWESRQHADIDIEMFRDDREVLFDVLDGWELFSMSDGNLSRWLRGDPIEPSVFGIWGRLHEGAPWAIEVMLADGDRSEWRFRRDPSITMPVDRLIRTSTSGIPYCTPEVQLLYKSKMARPKDDIDLAHCLHRLAPEQRRWLLESVARSTPHHPWVGVLQASLDRQHE
jgi:hypothetical protein